MQALRLLPTFLQGFCLFPVLFRQVLFSCLFVESSPETVATGIARFPLQKFIHIGDPLFRLSHGVAGLGTAALGLRMIGVLLDSLSEDFQRFCVVSFFFISKAQVIQDHAFVLFFDSGESLFIDSDGPVVISGLVV